MSCDVHSALGDVVCKRSLKCTRQLSLFVWQNLLRSRTTTDWNESSSMLPRVSIFRYYYCYCFQEL